ncbi:hypothetical protein BJ138DRAFT_1119405 [Hygrophoropsis aurantiaca]|uniref:Uncharacterized protein n=1 Tax=Hygrophoropsis aurantiaca TaxID=72124 RepID=A0ACB7ZTR3_9AGAM|nr:hypothetical protein BJ138DRAFT_1119405 [Hygrophoropsis aurantiaca]
MAYYRSYAWSQLPVGPMPRASSIGSATTTDGPLSARLSPLSDSSDTSSPAISPFAHANASYYTPQTSPEDAFCDEQQTTQLPPSQIQCIAPQALHINHANEDGFYPRYPALSTTVGFAIDPYLDQGHEQPIDTINASPLSPVSLDDTLPSFSQSVPFYSTAPPVELPSASCSQNYPAPSPTLLLAPGDANHAYEPNITGYASPLEGSSKKRKAADDSGDEIPRQKGRILRAEGDATITECLDNLKKAYCNKCDTTFNKDGISRHLQTRAHLSGRPPKALFVCDVCGTDISRSDALKRHRTSPNACKPRIGRGVQNPPVASTSAPLSYNFSNMQQNAVIFMEPLTDAMDNTPPQVDVYPLTKNPTNLRIHPSTRNNQSTVPQLSSEFTFSMPTSVGPYHTHRSFVEDTAANGNIQPLMPNPVNPIQQLPTNYVQPYIPQLTSDFSSMPAASVGPYYPDNPQPSMSHLFNSMLPPPVATAQTHVPQLSSDLTFSAPTSVGPSYKDSSFMEETVRLASDFLSTSGDESGALDALIRAVAEISNEENAVQYPFFLL